MLAEDDVAYRQFLNQECYQNSSVEKWKNSVILIATQMNNKTVGQNHEGINEGLDWSYLVYPFYPCCVYANN